jgi:hypothetical protein
VLFLCFSKNNEENWGKKNVRFEFCHDVVVDAFSSNDLIIIILLLVFDTGPLEVFRVFPQATLDFLFEIATKVIAWQPPEASGNEIDTMSLISDRICFIKSNFYQSTRQSTVACFSKRKRMLYEE